MRVSKISLYLQAEMCAVQHPLVQPPLLGARTGLPRIHGKHNQSQAGSGAIRKGGRTTHLGAWKVDQLRSQERALPQVDNAGNIRFAERCIKMY